MEVNKLTRSILQVPRIWRWKSRNIVEYVSPLCIAISERVRNSKNSHGNIMKFSWNLSHHDKPACSSCRKPSVQGSEATLHPSLQVPRQDLWFVFQYVFFTSCYMSHLYSSRIFTWDSAISQHLDASSILQPQMCHIELLDAIFEGTIHLQVTIDLEMHTDQNVTLVNWSDWVHVHRTSDRRNFK